jgi:hypothetical protein
MKKYIEENIEKLRQDKENKVVGGYRDQVFKTFIYLKKGIKMSKTDYVNPKYSDISKVVFGSRNEERKIRGLIKDLKNSGYISVYGVGEHKEIKILKDIDF